MASIIATLSGIFEGMARWPRRWLSATGETPVVPVSDAPTGKMPVVPVSGASTGKMPVVPVLFPRFG